jgi:hypothetical protein
MSVLEGESLAQLSGNHGEAAAEGQPLPAAFPEPFPERFQERFA